MVRRVLVGLRLLLLALMSSAFGDLYQRAGRDSFHTFPLWPAMALPAFFGMINGVITPL